MDFSVQWQLGSSGVLLQIFLPDYLPHNVETVVAFSDVVGPVDLARAGAWARSAAADHIADLVQQGLLVLDGGI
jgi:hypothetical protein